MSNGAQVTGGEGRLAGMRPGLLLALYMVPSLALFICIQLSGTCWLGQPAESAMRERCHLAWQASWIALPMLQASGLALGLAIRGRTRQLRLVKLFILGSSIGVLLCCALVWWAFSMAQVS